METDQVKNCTCDICGNAIGNKRHVAREMMHGTREEFTYLECAVCGCLQNISVPSDLSRYYGSSYYSMGSSQSKSNPVRDFLKRRRTFAYLGGGTALDRFLLKRFGPPGLLPWVKELGMRQDSSVLEVGCGSGAHLLAMQGEGFTDLTGADPFIERDIDHGRGLNILKADIDEVPGTYDFVVLEHAFEHIPNPRKALESLGAKLSPGGTLVIGIPLVGEAWSLYGVNWMQLDAPRHLYLHTERSFRLLAKDMTVVNVVYNSGPRQFWGSEQYAQNIPLLDERSYQVNPSSSIFSEADIERFRAMAEDLNARRAGDQADFYLQLK